MDTAIIIGSITGGIVRGLVGFIKHRYAYKEVKFDLAKFVSTLLISGLVGLVAGFTLQEFGFPALGVSTLTPALGLLVGYAGGDFLENLWKILLKKQQ